MKKLSFVVAAFAASLMVSATSCQPVGKANLKTDIDSVCYAIGVTYGSGFAEQLKTFPGGEANKDALVAGFVEALNGKETKITADKAQEVIQAYFTNAAMKDAAKAKEEGEKFLEENKAKEGVKTTPSGLQYKVITEGTGEKPTEKSTVTVHYKGTLLDGTEFDSSYSRNEPTKFTVNQVIPGWTEGLQLMPAGSKYIFWIPSELAYGERGAGQQIKPNSVLTFEVELISVEDPKK